MAERPTARRADARRNIAAILGAGEECLARDAEATMADVAREAGVGRVTLYGHFPSRAELVEAVLRHVLAEADATLEAVDTRGAPEAALRRLVESSWRIVFRSRSVLAAAERDLPADVVRAHHDRALARVTDVLTRGREAGVFRTDVPVGWLATVCMTLMHTAAAEVRAGRLDDDAAEHAVVVAVVGACRG